MADMNTFDFMISEDNEVMLVIYARETEPVGPAVRLIAKEQVVELYRNGADALTLQEVGAEIFNNLHDKEKLLVCEIAPTDNPDETEIVYAYEATIVG
ncbi:MAG: hypothetical protein IJ525_01650 [Alphaproteobacteria bacterium]|nr:hypothetical protein [Alphaproteobacteria bacterium]MBR3501535.1 hypothetical protein [Alphaproteobacteria bacterium]